MRRTDSGLITVLWHHKLGLNELTKHRKYGRWNLSGWLECMSHRWPDDCTNKRVRPIQIIKILPGQISWSPDGFINSFAFEIIMKNDILYCIYRHKKLLQGLTEPSKHGSSQLVADSRFGHVPFTSYLDTQVFFLESMLSYVICSSRLKVMQTVKHFSV